MSYVTTAGITVSRNTNTQRAAAASVPVQACIHVWLAGSSTK